MKASGTDSKKIAMVLGLSLKTVMSILKGKAVVGKVSTVISHADDRLCEGCNQFVRANSLCKKCERDRKLGARIRSRFRLVEFAINTEDGDTLARLEQSRQARARLAVELPEAVKLPQIRKWDNIEPLRPSDRDIVESLAMLVGVGEPAQIDEHDERWTVAK